MSLEREPILTRVQIINGTRRSPGYLEAWRRRNGVASGSSPVPPADSTLEVEPTVILPDSEFDSMAGDYAAALENTIRATGAAAVATVHALPVGQGRTNSLEYAA